MRILVISSHVSNKEVGGEGKRAFELIKYIGKEKSQINSSILTYKLANKSMFKSINSKLTEIPYFKKRFKFPIINFKVLKQIHALIGEADTVHVMGSWSFLNIIAYPSILWKSKPYSISMEGSLNIIGRSKFYNFYFIAFIEKYIIKNACKLIYIVDDEKVYFCKYGANKDNIIKIENGINEADNILKSNVKKIGNLNLSKSYILFIGRLNYIKGPDILLDAFILISKNFPDYSLVFVGYDEGLMNGMIKKVDECKLQDRVFFLGYQNGKEKSALYSKASLVVIPSRSNANSRVFLEAAIHKTPVITTNKCDLNHINKFNMTKIYEASSVEIAQSITKVLGDKKWKNTVSNQLYNFVLKNYSWDTISKQYINVFEKSIINYNHANYRFRYFRQILSFLKTKSFIKLNNNSTATHAPVLIGLAKNFIINNVLELGCGNISTSIFLNSSLFKNLDNLTTYENNKVWYDLIKKKHKKDSRWNFKFTNTQIYLALEKEAEEKKTYDLIFIDDSNSSFLRSQTIKYALNIKNIFLVIHDYENAAYKAELKNFDNKFVVKSLIPQTVILYNGAEKVKIEKLLDTIKYYSKKIEVNDYENWKKIL